MFQCGYQPATDELRPLFVFASGSNVQCPIWTGPWNGRQVGKWESGVEEVGSAWEWRSGECLPHAECRDAHVFRCLDNFTYSVPQCMSRRIARSSFLFVPTIGINSESAAGKRE